MNFENDAALGLSATETTRNAAANKAFGKSFKDLSEAQKQLTLLQMVEDANKISGAMGMAAKESDGLENVIGNLSQSWTDLKAAVGEPIMVEAIDQMIELTHWMGRIDGQKIADSLMAAGAYLSDTFGPILGEVKEDLQGLWSVLSGDGAETEMQNALNDLQTGMQWIAENWEGVKDGVFALTGAFVAYRGAVAGLAVFTLINGLMASYALVAGTTTVAQWALNTAMAANPLSLVALAIAGVVAAAILLWRNWDIVKEKTLQVFNIFGGFPGIARTVFFPIMTLIDAGKAFVDQWDSSATIWENIWGGIRAAAESSMNSIIDNINKLINTINLIPGINIPIIPKVDWTPLAPITSGGINGKGTGYSLGMGVQGSHATGLARVPFDSYTAELHKDEAVLTASQANTLRGMGALKSNAGKPVLDSSALSGSRTGTGRKIQQASVKKNSVVIRNLNINGAQKTTKDIVRELVAELEYAMKAGAME